MVAINSNLVPTVSPGSLFTRLTTDTTINIRWLTATDPVYFEILNRPLADIALRQLIIAKSIDQLNTALGYIAMFPFLVQPVVTSGSNSATVPIRLFWDSHVSLPKKWKNLRLARIDRISGTNGTTYTGVLRFIFVANEELGGGSESTVDTAIFYVDYTIDSALTYQIAAVQIPTVVTTPGLSLLASSESQTIGGSIIFKTGDATETEVATFYDLVVPTGTYDIASTVGGTGSESFDSTAMTYGTGLLVSSAYNAIPNVDSDPSYWLLAFNYPFNPNVTTMSSDDSTVVIWPGMFNEFSITAPTSDQPTGDTTGAFFPVWISKLEKISDSPVTVTFTFSTFSIEQPGVAVEFAEMTLIDTYVAGRIVEIAPTNHLYTLKTALDSTWYQEFGRGHVRLSNSWGTSGGGFADFFAQFPSVSGMTTEWSFSATSTLIGAFGLSRVPKYSPTSGQAAALMSSSARFTTPIYPSNTNRYITEQDCGLGNTIDLDVATGNSHTAIERYGNSGTNIRRIVKLVVDISHNETNFYTNYILPRLTILLGRAPVFGDVWYNGTRFMTYNSDSWVG